MTKKKIIALGVVTAILGVGLAYTMTDKVQELEERLDNQTQMLYNKDKEVKELNVRLKEREKVINDLVWEKNHLKEEIEERSKAQASRGSGRQIPVKVTHYSAEETGSNITASGEVGIPYYSVAYNGVSLGTHIRMNGKEYVVTDRCGYDDTIDIFVNSTAEALSLGAYNTVMEVID